MMDVRKLMSASMAKARVEMERMVAEAEKICATNQLASNVQVHALGVLSCHLTLCALAKKHSNLPKFENMEEAGVKFIGLLRELSGNGNIACPWSLALTASTSAGIPAKAAKSEKKTESVGNI